MTLIDEKIVEIFNKLLNNSEYFEGTNSNCSGRRGYYLFYVNNVNIGLDIFMKSSKGSTSNEAISLELQKSRCWEWDICPHDMEGYTFYLWINNRQYVVPPMSRSEEVSALDKIEQMLRKWELETLNKVLL